MSLHNHIAALARRHSALKDEIERELHQVAVNAGRLAALKRRKLSLKDEMAKLKRAEGRTLH